MKSRTENRIGEVEVTCTGEDQIVIVGPGQVFTLDTKVQGTFPLILSPNGGAVLDWSY